MKILLLSAYDAASHQRWRKDLECQFNQYDWTQLSLPPRYFNWRIRGNSLSWAFTHQELLSRHYDLLIATSMVDLSALRGFIPSLAFVPTLLYFHENQFAYPASEDQFASVEPQMLTLYSALCADKLVFNSSFNRATFIHGVEELLRRLPDHVPVGIPTLLAQRSCVLSVPLDDSHFAASMRRDSPLELIWNHRWEYDKGPERLLAMLKIFFTRRNMQDKTPPFILHVVGQQFRKQPSAFAEIQQLLMEHHALGQWGFLADTSSYRRLLAESHIVLSTALHDFQGISVLEAVAAGCVPLVPERQAYPEWFGPEHCYPEDLETPEAEAHSMAVRLQQLIEHFAQAALAKAPDISHFAWSNMLLQYDQLFRSVAGKIIEGRVE